MAFVVERGAERFGSGERLSGALVREEIAVSRHCESTLQRGFTLVELIVVMAIIGLLIALLLPAVQSARESGRRAACQNNLRNQGVALQNFHALHRHFPAGHWIEGVLEFSWCLELLPQLEQASLADQFDRTKPIQDAAGNLAIAMTPLSVFCCPSAVSHFPGKTDYGGIMGSALTSTTWANAFNNGVMIEVVWPKNDVISLASITDGSSQTICVAEASDREPLEGGMWITGYNCFSHDNGVVNSSDSGEIHSRHVGGAFVAMADGATRFLQSRVDAYVIGALCTRDHGEVIAGTSY